ncbi:MAG: P-loop NTPase fold protein [Bacteroidales bacterium]
MWNDNDTNIDLIDYTYLVNAVASILEDDEMLPITIGVYGDWGSGKSSLMRMIEDSVSNEETLCIKFNGWLFEGYDDAKGALMKNIIEETIKNRTLGEKAKKIARKLLKNIDWLKLAKTAAIHGATFLTTGGIGNLALLAGESFKTDKGLNEVLKSFSAGDYDDYIQKLSGNDSELEMGIREFHEDFGNLLKETKIKKLVVFIDDLDRCLSDTVIATLEAIKLFLFAPNTAFIIGADEQLIQYAVSSRFPKIPGEMEVSRDYLEKLIQIPLRIPPMSEFEVETYINLLFTQQYFEVSKFEEIRGNVIKLKNDNLFSSIFNSENAKDLINDSIPPKLIDDLILSRQIFPVLSASLNGNPRQCKRFLNTLLLRVQMADKKGIELEKKILAKLMLLEYFKLESFRQLFGWQVSQGGKSKELKKLETVKESDDKNIKSWIEDKWLMNWVNQEPKLSDIDLRPYYYFARESLSQKIGITVSRISIKAQEALKDILSKSDSLTTRGITQLVGLPHSDVSGVFQELTARVSQEENKNERSKILTSLLKITEKFEELASELLVFLERLPNKLIGVSFVPKLYSRFISKSNEGQMVNILKKWASDPKNKALVKAANNYLKKIN